MKILIGTPIHECKDYSIPRWLVSLKELDWPDKHILLVDNSIGTSYADDLRLTTGYRTLHIDVDTGDPEERVGIAEEKIREIILNEGYDYWFAWDCDILLPSYALKELVKFCEEFDVVLHAYPDRVGAGQYNVGGRFGCALIKRNVLAQYGFLLQYGEIDPLNPNCWHGTEPWFLRRVIRGGGKYVELYGLIRPIVHLNE